MKNLSLNAIHTTSLSPSYPNAQISGVSIDEEQQRFFYYYGEGDGDDDTLECHSFDPISVPISAITCMEYVPDIEKVVIATKIGSLFTWSGEDELEIAEEVALCSGPILAMSFSPTGEHAIIVVDKDNSVANDDAVAYLLCTSDFSLVPIVDFVPKVTRTRANVKVITNTKSRSKTRFEANQVDITWRPDGSMWAWGFTSSSSGDRYVEIWSIMDSDMVDHEDEDAGDARVKLISQTETGTVFGKGLSWKPSKNGAGFVTAMRESNDCLKIVLIEPSTGKTHIDCDMTVDPNVAVTKMINWNNNGEILTVLIKYDDLSAMPGYHMLFYRHSNFHWYCLRDHYIGPGSGSESEVKWDSRHPLRLWVCSSNNNNATVTYFDYSWSTCASNDGSVAVIAGKSLYVTHFSLACIPPPLSSLVLDYEENVNIVSFASSNSKSESKNMASLCVVLAGGDIIITDVDTSSNTPSPTTRRFHSSLLSSNVISFIWTGSEIHALELEKGRDGDKGKDEDKCEYVVLSIDGGGDGGDRVIVKEKVKEKRCLMEDAFPSTLSRMTATTSLVRQPANSHLYSGVLYTIPVTIANVNDVEVEVDIFTDTNNQGHGADTQRRWSWVRAIPLSQGGGGGGEFQVIALDSSTSTLFAGDHVILRNCASVTLHSSPSPSSSPSSSPISIYIIIATTHIGELYIFNQNQTQKLSESESETSSVFSLFSATSPRTIEQGGMVVTACGTKVILQMPRGNLETVHPRAMVVSEVKKLLDGREYMTAFELMRIHRIDMNLMFDHFLPLDRSTIDEVVLALCDEPEYLTLLISQLKGTNITMGRSASAYSQYYPERQNEREREREREGNSKQKHCIDIASTSVNQMSIEIRNSMLKLCETKTKTKANVDVDVDVEVNLRLPIITTYVTQTPKRIEDALVYIWNSCSTSSPASHTPSHPTIDADQLKDALSYLLLLVPSQDVYMFAAASGIWLLAAAVVSHTDRDPQVEGPFLEEMRTLCQSSEGKGIGVELGRARYRYAVFNRFGYAEGAVAELVKYDQDAAIQMVYEKPELWDVLHTFATDSNGDKSESKSKKRLLFELDRVKSRILFNDGKYDDAGWLACSVGEYELAVQCFVKSLDWRTALVCSKRVSRANNSDDDGDGDGEIDYVEQTATALVDGLCSKGQYGDAATVLREVLGDRAGSIKLMIHGNLWSEALRQCVDAAEEERVKQSLIESIDRLEDDIGQRIPAYTKLKKKLSGVLLGMERNKGKGGPAVRKKMQTRLQELQKTITGYIPTLNEANEWKEMLRFLMFFGLKDRAYAVHSVLEEYMDVTCDSEGEVGSSSSSSVDKVKLKAAIAI